MPLENATRISELDPANPTGSDSIGDGDNHIRMIKQVLQNEQALNVGKIKHYTLAEAEALDDAVIGQIVQITDRDNAQFEYVLASGVSPNTYDIIQCTGVPTLALKLIVNQETSCLAFGALFDGTTDDTGAIQAMIDEGTVSEYVIGSCVHSELSFPGLNPFTIKLSGDVKVSDDVVGDVYLLAGETTPKSQVNINLNGFEIDVNKDNQTNRFALFQTDYVDNFIMFNGKVKNVKAEGVKGTLSTYNSHFYSNVEFEEGALHTGVTGESTRFISLFGGRLTTIQSCSFKQLTAPLINENRNPSGVFVSGGNGDKVLIVEDCTFDNLGCNVAGNLEAPLDLYSYAQKVEYRRNKFTNSRFNPYRATNAGVAIIENNEVIQDSQIINDGGGEYADASCLNVGIVRRSFTVNDQENLNYIVRGNTHTVNGNNCAGMVISSDSTTHIARNAELSNNKLLSTGTNSKSGVFISAVKSVKVNNPEIKGFNRDIECQLSDNLTTILSGLSESDNCSLAISGGKLNSSTGLFARNSVANLTTRLSGVDMSDCGADCFSVRDSKNLFVTECVMSSSGNGDTANNDAFYYWNNIASFGSDPTGFNTNAYYRLYNNVGRADQESP